jgi:hypothetical protein
VSVTLAALPPPRDPASDVVGLTWDKFLSYMADVWEPGQHLAAIGPTGEGKTTTIGGLLSTRKWVMALDPKGEDETLSATGYERVFTLPTEFRGLVYRVNNWAAARQWDAIENRIAKGLPARIIVGGPSRTVQQDASNQDLMRRSFAYAREAGGWTVYVDEFELVSSARQFNLGKNVERMLISARRDGTSVVTSFQAPAWVSKHATRQARFTLMWPTGDEDMIQAVARGMGRNWRDLKTVVENLPPFHVAVVPRGPLGGPYIVTSAPKL